MRGSRSPVCTYADKLLHLALLHALLELALLVRVESSQSARVVRGQLAGNQSDSAEVRGVGEAYTWSIAAVVCGVRACVGGLDGFVDGRRYGGFAWVWGQNAAKEIWELLSALVMSRNPGGAPGGCGRTGTAYC